MKKIKTLLIAVLVITSTSVFAQQKTIAKKKSVGIAQTVSKQVNTPEERAKKETEIMKKELNLSDEQTERVSILNLKVEQKIQAIVDGDLPEDKKKEFIAGNMNEKLKVLSTILDEKQLAKYKALIANKKI